MGLPAFFLILTIVPFIFGFYSWRKDHVRNSLREAYALNTRNAAVAIKDIDERLYKCYLVLVEEPIDYEDFILAKHLQIVISSDTKDEREAAFILGVLRIYYNACADGVSTAMERNIYRASDSQLHTWHFESQRTWESAQWMREQMKDLEKIMQRIQKKRNNSD